MHEGPIREPAPRVGRRGDQADAELESPKRPLPGPCKLTRTAQPEAAAHARSTAGAGSGPGPGKVTAWEAGAALSPEQSLAYSSWMLDGERGWSRPSPAASNASAKIDRYSDSGVDPDQGALASAFEFIAAAGGQAQLPEELAKRLADELGVDAARIRLHTDDRAAAAAAKLSARAFTIGDDIYFAAGAYDPHSEAGLELIAHEVAHVAQNQRSGGGASAAAGNDASGRAVSRPDDAHERQADALASRFAARHRGGVVSGPGHTTGPAGQGPAGPGQAGVGADAGRARHSFSTNDPAELVEHVRRAGQRIDLPFAADLEQHFGTSLDFVETYTGQAAQLACNLMSAGAFAVRNIVALADVTPQRDQLMHELTHVMQMGGRAATAPRVFHRGSLRIGDAHSDVETEASAHAAAPTHAADRNTIHRDPTGSTPGATPAADKPDMSEAKVLERVNEFKGQDGRAKLRTITDKAAVAFAAADGARFHPRYYQASGSLFSPAMYAPAGSKRTKEDLTVAFAKGESIRLSKVSGMDAYIFTGDGDYKAEVKEVTAQAKWKGYKKSLDAIVASSGTKIPFTWPKNGTRSYTEEDPGLSSIETDDYRDAMRTGIATAFKDKTGKWEALYKHVVVPQHFAARICGDIFEEVVVLSAAELPNKFGNPSLDQPVFDVATFPELAPGSNIKGDGTMDLKIEGDHVLIECKAYTNDPNAENKKQMGKYKKMLGKTGYKIKGAVQSVAFTHVCYVVTVPSDPVEKQARLVKWHTALKTVFDEGEYSLVPAPTGLTTPFKIEFNPSFTFDVPAGQKRIDLTNPRITHPGLHLTSVNAAFDDLGNVTSGQVTYGIEAGDLKKDNVSKPIAPNKGGAAGGRVDNKLTGLTSKLGSVLKDADISAAIVDGGVEATIKIGAGAVSGLAGFTVEAVELKAKYSGEGALAVTGSVNLKHKNGKIAAAVTVGYDNGWSFEGTATISDGFIPGVSSFTATVARSGSGDWTISAEEITIEKQLKAVKLTGKGRNLTYDTGTGNFSGSATLLADMGMFGNASGTATIQDNKLTKAELSYDSPEFKYPAKSGNPAFKGTFGGTVSYDEGKLSGAVRGTAGLNVPALQKLAGDGGLGLALDGQIHPDGHYTGSIGTTTPLKFGKHFQVPSVACTIKDDGSVEGDFKIKVVDFKYLENVELGCKVDKSGVTISEAAVRVAFGSEASKFRGSLDVAFSSAAGLTITGQLSVKIKEGMVATGTLTYDSKENKVTVALTVDEITLLKHGPVTKQLFKFGKQIPLVNVYGLGVYLDIGFNLDFNYEFDLRLKPTITLEDLAMETFEYKEVKAEIELLGQLAARLVATPKVGLGLFALSPSLLRGGGGVMIPITGEALLKPKGKFTVAYAPGGGASGDVELGMALTFGIKGAVKPYAELSLLDGVWNPSWVGDSLADFEIMPPKELFNFNLDLGGDLKKQDPKIPDAPGAPTGGGGGKQIAQEAPQTKEVGGGTADRNAAVAASGPAGASGGLPDDPVKLGSMTSGLKGLPGYKTIENIMKKAGAAWEKIKGFFGRVAKAFKSFFDSMAGAMEEIIDGFAAEGLGYLPKLVRKVVGETAWEVIEPLITAVASSAERLLELFETDPPTGVTDVFPWALKLAANAWGMAFGSIGALVSALRTMISKLGGIATKLVTKMVSDGMIGVKRHTYWVWGLKWTGPYRNYFFAATQYKIHLLGASIDFYDEGNITDPRSVVGIGLFEVLEQMGVPPLNARVDDRINGGESSRDRWA